MSFRGAKRREILDRGLAGSRQDIRLFEPCSFGMKWGLVRAVAGLVEGVREVCSRSHNLSRDCFASLAMTRKKTLSLRGAEGDVAI